MLEDITYKTYIYIYDVLPKNLFPMSLHVRFRVCRFRGRFRERFREINTLVFLLSVFSVKQRLPWPSVMPSPVAFGKAFGNAFGKSTVPHFCFRFLFCQEVPAEDVTHCSHSVLVGHSMPPQTAQTRSSNQLDCVILQFLSDLKLLTRSSCSTCGIH